MESNNNPVAVLIRQALSLAENSVGIPVIVDYDAITRAAVKTAREEKERLAADPRVLLTQNEAVLRYGKSVISALVKRGKLQQYKFDTREARDKDGGVVVKAKGVIYYRVVEIEQAVEEGNVYKGTRRV